MEMQNNRNLRHYFAHRTSICHYFNLDACAQAVASRWVCSVCMDFDFILEKEFYISFNWPYLRHFFSMKKVGDGEEVKRWLDWKECYSNIENDHVNRCMWFIVYCRVSSFCSNFFLQIGNHCQLKCILYP